MKRGTYRVKRLSPKTHSKYTIGMLWRFPNIHISGSVMGMKNLYWGLDAKCVRCGNYIYNVSSAPHIYDEAT